MGDLMQPGYPGALYLCLWARANPTKGALVAVMRKLLPCATDNGRGIFAWEARSAFTHCLY